MQESRIKNLSLFGTKLQDAVDGITDSTKPEITLTSLAGSAGQLFISLFSDKVSHQLLVICSSYESAERTQKDLEFFVEKSAINFFPHWDTIPYDNQSPDKDVIAVRFHALANILDRKAKIVITTPNALMQQLMPPSIFSGHCFQLNTAQRYSRNELLHRLILMGFVRVDMVEEKGEFSVRGEIIDIFPISEVEPVRLDFFDDELETIKYFDIETQRSTRQISSVAVFPAQEVVYTDESAEMALRNLAFLKADTVPQTYHQKAEQIQANLAFPGIESLLPIFYPSTALLLDYYNEPPDIVFIDKNAVQERAKHFFAEVLSEYEYSKQEGNPTLDPDKLFLTDKALFQSFASLRRVDIQSLNLENQAQRFDLSTVDNSAIRSIAVSSVTGGLSSTLNILEQLKKWHQAGSKIVIAAGSQSKAERIKQTLEDFALTVPVFEKSTALERKAFFIGEFSVLETSFCIVPVSISNGFRWVDQLGNTKVTLISDEEIFGPRQKQRRIKKTALKHFFSSLGDLKVGDYVVHVEYGIGRYQGLKKITAGQKEADYLVIAYQEGDKVYVPVDKFHLVQKYAGGEAVQPKINKLGTKTWAKTKSKVRTEIDDIADELIRINAERQARKGVAFSPDSALMNEFTLGFQYQETEDQERVIREVLKDMEMEKPMERLVCGDVGFGKTEVAMRAAYKAVIDSYQVGILVPTTILAQQHYETFRERLQNTAVSVGLLSRFQTPRQIKATLKQIEQGQVDIVIGTHRLLSKDVCFKRLGLLVIDEEQRFGVKHKESIKKLRTTVDTLTLSATPIPRTLQMSMVGIRDISVINTPPMDRRAVRTRLIKFNDYVIQEGVNREIRRNGQVYFIHNRVDSIFQVREYLNQILPKVSIAIGHGQMAERELEQVMFDFINRKYDVLLSTTIVESGLDIPNVNTIFINNAEKFGLSQLYQLRGRVGRSNVQAYSYLLIPREKILTENAQKRLSILQELNHLGAGFKIASYDLELRGAGNVLGTQQSGHISAVGFELYTSMVEEAVARIQKGEAESQPKDEIKLNLAVEANLPDTYIDSMNQRLDAYKEISSCKTEDDLWVVRSTLEDRFGPLPKNSVYLFHLMQIKFLAADLHITELNQSFDSLELFFSERFKPEPAAFIKFLHGSSFKPRMLAGNKLKIQLPKPEPEKILRFLFAFRKEIFPDGRQNLENQKQIDVSA